MSTYQETVKYLYEQTPLFQQIGAAAYKPGLDSTRRLDNAFENPHRSFRCIHVGGTNGKGSTAHTLAAILQAQGYKVGLYTSPHLVDFRERIKVNGLMISEAEVVAFVDRVRSIKDIGHLSFFELATIMAFDHFRRNRVDYAVIEVGLGGRLDCTNIITPIMSVITNISKDHVAQLGNTLTAIAGEKAGIIKEGIPVVIGEAEGEVLDVFLKRAAEVEAPLFRAPSIGSHYLDDEGMMIYSETPFGEIRAALAGDCQPLNSATIMTAVEVLRTLGIRISNDAVKNGFSNVVTATGLMGRWMTLQRRPTIICDTAHNEGGLKYITDRLNRIEGTLRVILGFCNDKEYMHVLETMPRKGIYYFTRADIPRSQPSEILAADARKAGLKGEAYQSVNDALEAALADSAPDDTIYIGGSTFIVADLMNIFQNTNV